MLAWPNSEMEAIAVDVGGFCEASTTPGVPSE
jgi:hypothetical protein